jgi:tetratricopeptide (TPR) repeat protein
MRKLLLACVATCGIAFASAQDGNNICVWNAMNTFNTGGGPEDLERGIQCSDEAAVNESTAAKSKTWFYRGELYTLIFQDKTLKAKYGNSAFEAVKAFKKLYELNDPKFKDWDEVMNYLIPLGTNVFNEGVEQYQNKNYSQAYQYFYAIKDINAVIEGKNKKGSIDLGTALKNAAISAENTGDMAKAMQVYKDWLAVAPEAGVYYRLSEGYKKAGDKEAAKKTIEEGIAKYPNDPNLLVGKINFYLEDSNYVAALGFINNLIAVEPKNDGALFIKGLAYEKLNNEDSVIYYYTKATEINPKNVRAWNNLGAWYINQTAKNVEEMNKLGNSAADNKRYEELKKANKDLYLKGKPYLQKAAELEPDNASIQQTLKKIELYTAE